MPAVVDLSRLVTRLRGPLARDLAAACLDSRGGDIAILALNERLTVAKAFDCRQRQFAGGRMAARVAMQRLARRQAHVPVNPDRSPSWSAGWVGSISHPETTCVTVVALTRSWPSVGVDVEPDLGSSSDLKDTILASEELKRVSQMPETLREWWATLAFCAKEAYYKWVYPRGGSILDYQSVVVDTGDALENTRLGTSPSAW